MAIVKEQESGKGEWQDLWVLFHEVAEAPMKNGSYRAIYKAGEKTFSLGLDPDDPEVTGFADGEPPTGSALRSWFGQNAHREPLWVTAKDNFIQCRSCRLNDDGGDKVHEGKLTRVYTYERPSYDDKDVMEARSVFILHTDEGERARLDDPTPRIEATVGPTPDRDVIDGELNREKGFFVHAIACGLDWQRFIQDMKDAPALWPRLGIDGPADSYFSSTEPLEWPKDILRHIQEHGGPLRVRWTMTKSEKGYVQVKRGRTKIEILETVPQQVSAQDKEWIEWRSKFCDAMDALTGQIHGNDKLRFADRATWFLTEAGIEVATNVVKPICAHWPHVAPTERMTTRIKSPDNWSTDLFIAIEQVAKEMVASQNAEYELAVGGFSDEANLLKWLEEHKEARKYLDFGQREL